MKQADVKIGATYLTYIGSWLTPVVVVVGEVIEFDRHKKKRTTYRVRQADKPATYGVLPKTRTAAALRSCT